MSMTLLHLLVAAFGLTTLTSCVAQQAAPGITFPFESVTPFTINATTYETETLVGLPNATSK